MNTEKTVRYLKEAIDSLEIAEYCAKNVGLPPDISDEMQKIMQVADKLAIKIECHK